MDAEYTVKKLLIVDDDGDMLDLLVKMLGKECQCETTIATSAESALDLVQRQAPDVVLTDIRMPGMGGIAFFQQINVHVPAITTILMSGYGTIELAVQMLKEGAYDFVEKPFDKSRIVRTVNRAFERTRLVRENGRLQQLLQGKEVQPHGFVGHSSAIRKTINLLERVASSNITVLVRGESGTGKELAAHALHAMSGRAHNKLITVNCPALPEAILESELFGYRRGAFTSADQDKDGLFLDADGSTILLDEIADIPVSVQTKLLRVLQEKEVRPLGQNRTFSIDVRVIASTNQDLEARMKAGLFREDLYHRLNAMPVFMPSLAQMSSDIPLLAHVFLEEFRKELGRNEMEFSLPALSYLMGRSWPGNVRELRNTVQRAVLLSVENVIQVEDFQENEDGVMAEKQTISLAQPDLSLPYKHAKDQSLQAFNASYLSGILREARGNITHAAKASGLDRQALQRLLRRYKIRAQTYRY